MKDATLIESISNYPREKDRDPLNLVNVDLIDDKSDRRTMWRHVTDFTLTNIVNSSFTNSDLTNTIFSGTTIENVDFSVAKMSNADIIDVNVSDVKFTKDIYFEDSSNIKSLTIPEENYKSEFVNLYFEKISNPNEIDLDIRFVDALDSPPINYAMGSIFHKGKLYVADTDNHRISVYDSDTLEPLIKFTSPMQHYCPGVNGFTTEKPNCPTKIRNLPTSLAILNEKIFVAYGFQDDIQIFDLNGNFITVFGNTGEKIGEFNEPYRIARGNNELYVADSQNNRIQVFNSNGEFLRQFTTSPDLITENSIPYDLKIFDNRIFVADSKRSSILIFDLNGNYLEELPIISGFPSSNITSVSIYDDLLYVTDQKNDVITVLDLDGNVIMNVGKTGDHYGEFKSPYYLTIDAGRMVVSDAKNYRIQIFDIVKTQ